MRLIDANEVIWKLKQRHDMFIDAWEGFSNLPEKDKARVDEISGCISEIFNASTVDAAPVVHGQWDDSGRYQFPSGKTAIRCSICGCALSEGEYHLFNWNYCPVCGAKMDGGNEDG